MLFQDVDVSDVVLSSATKGKEKVVEEGYKVCQTGAYISSSEADRGIETTLGRYTSGNTIFDWRSTIKFSWDCGALKL